MSRWKKIAARLEGAGLDALLITSRPGQRYALGMQGEGVVAIAPHAVQFSTDGRYIEAARAQLTGVEVCQVGGGITHLSLAADFLRRHDRKRVGFESGYMTVDAHARYAAGLPFCQLIPAQALLDSLRAAKDEGELDAMRRAQAITEEAFEEILNFLRPGLTEQEVAARLVYELLRRGGERVAFDPIVAAGPGGSRPHAVPGQRRIEKGTFVTLDFGCVWGGYCSDMTRTVAVGQPTQEMERVYQLVLKAQEAGIAAARAGVPGREIDTAGRQVIEAGGYGAYFSHSFGHSLGLEVHEGPSAAGGEERIMPDGAVISAEPGIYLPGRFGVRIEDVLILRPGGCENITHAPKELLVL